MLAWAPFTTPLPLPWDMQLWLIVPLCFGVAIVYKTIRTKDLNRLSWQIISLCLYMLLGLAALGAGLWLLARYWP